MGGTCRWRDNGFHRVERLWRSLTYEAVYLQAYETIRNAQGGVAQYLAFDNEIRPHRALDGRTPDRMHWEHRPTQPSAA